MKKIITIILLSVIVRIVIIILIMFVSIKCLSQDKKVYKSKNQEHLSLGEISVSFNRILSISNHVNPKNGFGFEINSYIKNSNKFKLILGLSFNITNQFNDRLTISYRSFYTNVSSRLYNLSIPLDFRFNLGKKSNVFIQSGVFINFAGCKITGTKEFIPGMGANNVSEVDKYLPLAPAIGVSFGMGLKFHLLDKEFFVKSDCKIGLNFLSKRSIRELSNVYGRFSVGIKI